MLLQAITVEIGALIGGVDYAVLPTLSGAATAFARHLRLIWMGLMPLVDGDAGPMALPMDIDRLLNRCWTVSDAARQQAELTADQGRPLW